MIAIEPEWAARTVEPGWKLPAVHCYIRNIIEISRYSANG